jgi:hypothetical protein
MHSQKNIKLLNFMLTIPKCWIIKVLKSYQTQQFINSMHSFIQYSVWRQVQSLLRNDSST